MTFLNIKRYYRQGMDRLHYHWFRPLMKKTARWLSNRANRNLPISSNETEWKTAALEDFQAWLADMPPTAPKAAKLSPDGCDLYTLLTEFTALRQEIKFQNREQHKTVRTQAAMVDGIQDALNLIESKTRELDRLEENIRLISEKKAVLPFLDMRDALHRGLSASRRVPVKRGLFRRTPIDQDDVGQGYEMAIRRFDRALSMVGIQVVDTKAKVFDPTNMKALERRKTPDHPAGVVLEEVACGFMRGREVIRTAQVIVSE